MDKINLQITINELWYYVKYFWINCRFLALFYFYLARSCLFDLSIFKHSKFRYSFNFKTKLLKDIKLLQKQLKCNLFFVWYRKIYLGWKWRSIFSSLSTLFRINSGKSGPTLNSFSEISHLKKPLEQ
jgi:hypothetical protein